MKGRPWTYAEIEILRRDYPTMTPAELAQKLPGRTIPSIALRAFKLKIGKSESFFREQHRRHRSHLTATQFKPGHGTGSANRKWVPVGSERTNIDGYRWRKVSETGCKNRDWRQIHVLVWEQNRGAIPTGKMVVFRDGDKANCEIDNLELITRREGLLRNTIHRFPKPLRRVIKLARRLERAVNEKCKEATP